MQKTSANFIPLSPISLLKRAARVYPQTISVRYGSISRTWLDMEKRSSLLASALCKEGIKKGDVVSVMAANTPELLEMHFGIPGSGAILNAINTRLDSTIVAYILKHSESKIIFVDTEFYETVSSALEVLKKNITVISILDSEFTNENKTGEMLYEEFIGKGDPFFTLKSPDDEWDTISLNYTSGTTAQPKGVLYHHRGAYLNSLSNILGWEMINHPRYLWTLPMYHCNGWCFPWSLAAVAGTSICIRKVTAEAIFNAINRYEITHFCCAPTVLNLIINSDESEKKPFKHNVKVMTAAAPPPVSIIEQMCVMGFELTHVYGLTETYGPATICAWKKEWEGLPLDKQAQKMARQGIPYHALEDVQILDSTSMDNVANDGSSLGEAMFRGNIIMKGYFKDPESTALAFNKGWFHSGDLGVMHEDSYIELKDRSKDIIISGGENISSIEIEDVLYKHPDILEAAVVAKLDNYWGEVPWAFVTLKNNHNSAGETDIIEYCKIMLAKYKVPKKVIFGTLPKTSTGKVQKFMLRKKANSL